MGQRNKEKKGRRVPRATDASRREKLQRYFGGKHDVASAKRRVKEAIK